MKIAVASGKGGVGKSMLASTLAGYFSQEARVVAVDADVDTPNLNIWLGEAGKWDRSFYISTSLRPKIDFKKCNSCGKCVSSCKFGVISMENGRPKVDNFKCEGCAVCRLVCPKGAIKMQPVKNGLIRQKNTNFGFKLVSGQLVTGESGSGKIVDQLKLEAEKISHQIMIIDSAPGTGCPVTAALRDADYAVLVGEPTPSAFSDLKKILSVVRHFSLPCGLVINKWDINPKLSKKIENWTGCRFLGKISYDRGVFKAVNNFNPIINTKLKARAEIRKIYGNLKEVIS